MEIRKITEKDVWDYYRIQTNAYPLQVTDNFQDYKEWIMRVQKENPKVDNYGVFQNNVMVGGMRLHDFRMNFCYKEIEAGGIGAVAVDLLHKKEHVCKEIMHYFHRQHKDKKILILYPFRPDFYYKMGFGYGPPLYFYQTKPASFPNKHKKSHLVYLGIDDQEALLEFFNRYATQTHGVVKKNEFEFEHSLRNHSTKVIAYRKDNKIQGYMIFRFQKTNSENFLTSDICIYEVVYENEEVLDEFMTFLHTQKDQVRHITFPTFDEQFYHNLDDVRSSRSCLLPPAYHDSAVLGVGLMYKVLDAKALIEELVADHLDAKGLKLKFEVYDSFTQQYQNFVIGAKSNKTDRQTQIEVKMESSAFSSLMVGAFSFRKAVCFGKATISDEDHIDMVDELFSILPKPQNYSWF